MMGDSIPLSYGVGLEFMPDWILPIRGGFRMEGDKMVLTAGAGVQYQVATTKFAFDYALNIDPERGFQSWFTLNLQKFSASLTDFTIGSIKMDDIFPSMYKFYSHSKISTIEIRNNTSLPIQNVKVSLFVKDYMDFPTDSDIIPLIQPRSSIKVDLPATFNNSVFDLTEETAGQAQFTVEYFADGKQQKLNQSKNFKLYGKTAMTWDDIGKLASFIMPKDTPVNVFARGLLQTYRDADLMGVNEKVASAALFFNALGKYGMTYVIAPDSPMIRKGNTSLAIDSIQFPRDSLRYKTAKCADETALFCSLLQNIGTPTALIDLKEHILMMFDTGVPEEEKERVSANPSRVVIRNGNVWVPVETTMFGKSFVEAWDFGIKLYRKGEADGKLTVVEVMRAWEDFAPVSLPPSTFEPQLPSRDQLFAPFNQDLVTIKSYGLENSIRDLESKIAQNPKDTSSMNSLAILYGKQDKFDEALHVLSQAISVQPNSAKLFNNLGNIYMLKGNFEKAEENYLKATQLNPDNPGYYINLAFMYDRKGDKKKAEEMIMKAEKLTK